MPKIIKTKDGATTEGTTAVQPIPADIKPVFPTQAASLQGSPVSELISQLVNLEPDARVAALREIFTSLGVEEGAFDLGAESPNDPSADAVPPAAWAQILIARTVEARRTEGKDLTPAQLRDEWTSFMAGTTEAQKTNVRHELAQVLTTVAHQAGVLAGVIRH
jgi:hypothetical protein